MTVFTLGGTTAMTPAGNGGATLALSAADLVKDLPGLDHTGIVVDVVDFRQVPGSSLGFDDMIALSKEASVSLAAGADGIVITQGTDTIEETSYLLDLYHHGQQSIVVTGAMRNPSLAGADGPANVLAAIIIAANRAAVGQGVLVAFSDEIHAAAVMPVVLASRTGAGSVLRETYGFPGSERDLNNRGLIPAGFLDPLKARLLLAAAIGSGATRQQIAAAFAVAGGYAEPRSWPWQPTD